MSYRDVVPTSLAPYYDQSMEDPELLSLRDDLSLTRSRIKELTKRLETKESGKAWSKLRQEMKGLRNALQDQRMDKAVSHLRTMQELITREGNKDDTWNQIIQMMNVRKQLTEAERRRIVDLQNMIDSNDAMSLMADVLRIIVETVDDPAVLEEITTRFKRVLDEQ